jgi:hypothetical protein
VSNLHAQWSALEIGYRLASAEDPVQTGEQLDAVLNMKLSSMSNICLNLFPPAASFYALVA